MGMNTKLRGLSRRRFLQVSATGVVTATTLGGISLSATSAHAAPYGEFTWISPRGTLEVLDDYPYWVAKEMGYFGDLKTKMEPGPSDGTATVKFVALSQADMGFPSPGVFSFALNNNLDLVSVWNTCPVDVFDFAFRKGQGVKDLKDPRARRSSSARRPGRPFATRCFRRLAWIQRASSTSRPAGRSGARFSRADKAMRRWPGRDCARSGKPQG